MKISLDDRYSRDSDMHRDEIVSSSHWEVARDFVEKIRTHLHGIGVVERVELLHVRCKHNVLGQLDLDIKHVILAGGGSLNISRHYCTKLNFHFGENAVEDALKKYCADFSHECLSIAGDLVRGGRLFEKAAKAVVRK